MEAPTYLATLCASLALAYPRWNARQEPKPTLDGHVLDCPLNADSLLCSYARPRFPKVELIAWEVCTCVTSTEDATTVIIAINAIVVTILFFTFFGIFR